MDHFKDRSRTIVVLSVLLCLVFFSVAAAAQSDSGSTPAAAGIGQKKARLIERVKRSTSVAIPFENLEGVPLAITESSSKELSNTEYRDLVGLSTPSDKVTSFPDVKLVNHSDRRVTSFTLFFEKLETKTLYFFKASGVDIAPHGAYFVSASRWVKAFSETPIDWDSEKVWLVGDSSEFTLKLAQVELEDGSKWVIRDSTRPSTESDARFLRVGFFGNARSGLRPNPNLLRKPPFSCVCSCGVTCRPGGGWDCTGHGESCSYTEASACLNNCCAAAAGYECNGLLT